MGHPPWLYIENLVDDFIGGEGVKKFEHSFGQFPIGWMPIDNEYSAMWKLFLKGLCMKTFKVSTVMGKKCSIGGC